MSQDILLFLTDFLNHLKFKNNSQPAKLLKKQVTDWSMIFELVTLSVQGLILYRLFTKMSLLTYTFPNVQTFYYALNQMGIQNCVQVIPGVSEAGKKIFGMVDPTSSMEILAWPFSLVSSVQLLFLSLGAEKWIKQRGLLLNLFLMVLRPKVWSQTGFRSLIRCVIRYITPLSIIQTFRMVVTIITRTVANCA